MLSCLLLLQEIQDSIISFPLVKDGPVCKKGSTHAPFLSIQRIWPALIMSATFVYFQVILLS